MTTSLQRLRHPGTGFGIGNLPIPDLRFAAFRALVLRGLRRSKRLPVHFGETAHKLAQTDTGR